MCVLYAEVNVYEIEKCKSGHAASPDLRRRREELIEKKSIF